MKKVFLILSVLILAASMSYATIVHIASVTRFSGDIMIKHGPDVFPLAVGALLCEGDEIWFLASRPNDWVEIRNVTLPNSPTFIIERADLPPANIPIYWDPTYNLTLTPKNGGEGSILIVPKDGFLPPLHAPELER